MNAEKREQVLLTDDGELAEPEPVSSSETAQDVSEQPPPDHSMLWLILQDTIGVWMPFLIVVFLWTCLLFLFTNPLLALIEMIGGLIVFFIYRLNVRSKTRTVGVMKFINQITKDVAQYRQPPAGPGRW